jgi:FAD/FMN-containing dehydrogenase
MQPRAPQGDPRLRYRTLDGDEAELPRAEIEALRATLGGRLFEAGHAEHERSRALWNAMVDRRPALVATCASASDVGAAVRFARTHAMSLSVRGGGHHIAGNAVAEGGLVIDLSRMRGVRVDPATRRARVQGGALLGDVDAACQAHALATPLGINSTTGFAGLCLGGGFGWLTRKHGLTIDNLVAAEIVGADGIARVVSETSEPDLFWAIRGGGGNFGVVTWFELALHPFGPTVHAGFVAFPGDEATAIARAVRDFDDAASDELSVWMVMRKAPPLPFLAPEVHGQDVVILPVFYAGDAKDGPKATAPVLSFGKPLGTMLGPLPYVAFQQALDPLLGPGFRNYWKTNEFAELTDEALDAVIEAGRAVPNAMSELFVGALGGAMGRVPSDATAYAGRDARFVMNVHGRWESPGDDARVRTWARETFARTAPFATGGGYVNFLTEDEASRVASAYGGNYERLREVKARFDPDNLFRMNHNVPPATRAGGRGERPSRGGRRPSA